MSEHGSHEGSSLFKQVPYEYGAIASGEAILFTAGACPLDADGNVVAPDDPPAQANAALRNLIAALAQFGARPQDLVKTTIYVVGDRKALVAVWNVIADGLAPYRPPSTLLGVSVLGYKGQLVEIEGIASVPTTETWRQGA
jgi:enamine deaminase RidA (YjgF/YER057c/UK114 family)